MSRYLLNKFLFTIDRDPELVERYRTDPRGTVSWWEDSEANRLLNAIDTEHTTWLAFNDVEREALSAHDYVTLFSLGAHPFLTWTLFLGLFEHDRDEPLGYHHEYARNLAQFTLPYPDLST